MRRRPFARKHPQASTKLRGPGASDGAARNQDQYEREKQQGLDTTPAPALDRHHVGAVWRRSRRRFRLVRSLHGLQRLAGMPLTERKVRSNSETELFPIGRFEIDELSIPAANRWRLPPQDWRYRRHCPERRL